MNMRVLGVSPSKRSLLENSDQIHFFFFTFPYTMALATTVTAVHTIPHTGKLVNLNYSVCSCVCMCIQLVSAGSLLPPCGS